MAQGFGTAMKYTVKHYSRFSAEQGVGSDLIRAEAWDALRLRAAGDDPFMFPPTRKQWQDKALANMALSRRADDLARFIQANGYSAVHSFGVGTAGLEFLLKNRLKEVIIRCSDYAPKTVEALAGFFPEAQAVTCNKNPVKSPAATSRQY